MKKNLVLLLGVFAFLGIWAVFTGSVKTITQINPFFFILAAIFFMSSVFIWVFCWALIVKKHVDSSFSFLFLLGFSSLIGSLTPIQSGSDAIRSVLLKKHLGLDYSSSFQASFIVKGLKFFILFFFTVLGLFFLFAGFFLSRTWFSWQDYFSSFLYFFSQIFLEQNAWSYLFFLSGLLVVFSGALLFLLPLNASFAGFCARFFSRLSKFHPFFGRLKLFFEKYPEFFKKTTFFEMFFFGALMLVSLLLEFLSLFFSFLSFDVYAPLYSVLVLFVLVAILERTPFLPRGIGVVEIVSFYFLSMHGFFFGFFLEPAVIGAVLVVFGFARIVVPILFGFAAFFLFSKKYGKTVSTL